MTRIKIDKWNPDIKPIEEAAKAIREGRLVAFPTETVYGLGANGLDPNAVRKIFAAKGRPSDNPLILHISNFEQAEKIAYISEIGFKIMKEFFPAPLTLVFDAKSCVPSEVRGGLTTVALRMPAHPVALALIEKSGVPIAAPSANRSGRPSPTDAQAVIDDLGDKVEFVLDAGECEIGVESTVIDVSRDEIYLLRPGGMPVEIIENFLKNRLLKIHADENKKKSSPGTRYRHYAPEIPVHLWRAGEKFSKFNFEGKIGYMGINDPGSKFYKKIIFDSVENYARGIFASLRFFERSGAGCIIAELCDEKGVGLALNDRLLRSSGCL